MINSILFKTILFLLLLLLLPQSHIIIPISILKPSSFPLSLSLPLHLFIIGIGYDRNRYRTFYTCITNKLFPCKLLGDMRILTEISHVFLQDFFALLHWERFFGPFLRVYDVRIIGDVNAREDYF